MIFTSILTIIVLLVIIMSAVNTNNILAKSLNKLSEETVTQYADYEEQNLNSLKKHVKLGGEYLDKIVNNIITDDEIQDWINDYAKIISESSQLETVIIDVVINGVGYTTQAKNGNVKINVVDKVSFLPISDDIIDVSNVYYDNSIDKYVYSIYYKNPKYQTTFALEIIRDEMTNHFESLQNNKSSILFVCDKKGTLVYSSSGFEHSFAVFATQLFEKKNSGDLSNGSGVIDPSSGETKHVFMKHLSNDWHVFYIVSSKELFSGISQIVIGYGFIFTIFLMFVAYMIISAQGFKKDGIMHRQIIHALESVYFAQFIVNVEENSYQFIYKDERIPKFAKNMGDYRETANEVVRKFIHPSDKIASSRKLNLDYIKMNINMENPSYGFDFKVIRMDQKTYYDRVTIVLVEATAKGTPKTVLITLQDITRTKLGSEETALLEAIDTTEICTFRYYPEQKTLYTNERTMEMYNIASRYNDLPDSLMNSFVNQEQRSEFVRMFNEINHGAKTSTCVVANLDKSIWCRFTITSVRQDEHGKNVLAIGIIQNISAAIQKEQASTENILRANVVVADAFEVVQKAEKTKTEFISRINHDVRVPLNTIIGLASVGLAHEEDKNYVHDCFKKISQSSDELLKLINQMIDVNQFGTEDVALLQEEISITKIVNSICEQMMKEISRKNLHFSIHIAYIKHDLVLGDAARVSQILSHIIDNAIKYTPSGGNVSLLIDEIYDSNKQKAQFLFQVEDNGIGMSEETLSRAFEPFARGDDPRVEEVPGSGLGLSIIKNVVNVMDGTISIRSELDKGTTVSVEVFFELPLEMNSENEQLLKKNVLFVCDDYAIEGIEEHLKNTGIIVHHVTHAAFNKEMIPQMAAVIVDGQNKEEETIEMLQGIKEEEAKKIIFSSINHAKYEHVFKQMGIENTMIDFTFLSILYKKIEKIVNPNALDESDPMQIIQSLDLASKRILVVEDNELNREIAMEMLSMTNVQVESAEDGKQAIEMVEAHEEFYYDLILMDIQMPVMDGIEATKYIRRMDREDVDGIPIIAMSANSFKEDIVRSIDAGIDEHISKPLSMDKLLKTLIKMVKFI